MSGAATGQAGDPAGPVIDRSGRDLLFTCDFAGGELSARRHRIAETIGPGAHLFIAGAPPMPGDVPVQDALFTYFCGLDVPHAYLLVEGGTGRATLFLPSRDVMSGEPSDRLGHEDAALIRTRLGFEAVASSEALTEALSTVRRVFVPHAELEGGGATRFSANGCAQRRAGDPWDRLEPRHTRLIRLLREQVPGIEVEDACPLINRMRTIKSPAEIDVLRQAGALAARVMVEGMKATHPGMRENRLQAIAEFVFRDQGHCGLGYGVIAASGTRIWDGHYHINNATMRAGEIVLMDCGPDLRHYTSDIARMWPVDGTFSPWHRRVYGLIVAYHKVLLELVRPGVRPDEIYAEAARRMLARCDDAVDALAGMRPYVEQMIARGVRYINHGVGLSVHDAIDAGWKDEPLREGFVCVLDPMIWCELERQYIRVEDTIVITADGCERLTGDAPFEIEAIEALMQQPSSFAYGRTLGAP